MPWRRPIRAVWHNAAVVALLLASLSSAAVLYVALDARDHDRANIARNQLLISDIQRDRLASCIRTYEAFREVFQPFFSGAPRARVRQFNRRIDRFQRRCPQQVGVTDQGRKP